MKKTLVIIILGLLVLTTGCVSIVNSDAPITSGSVFIAEIAPGLALPVARLIMGGDNSYTVEVTQVSDVAVFSGLQQEYVEYSSQSGRWRYFMIDNINRPNPYINLLPHPDSRLEIDGVYNLYIGNGSKEDILTGVEINIVGTGTNAKIEFLR